MIRLFMMTAAAALLWSTPSNAVTKTAHFYFAGSHKNLGETERYSSGDLDLTVHAFNLSDNDPALIRRSLYGIGVDTDPGRGEDSQSSFLDDIGEDEALIFQFDPSVSFRRVLVRFEDGNDDINFFATNDDSVLDVRDAGESGLASRAQSDIFNTYGGSGGGLDWIDMTSLAGTWEYLVAYGGNPACRYKKGCKDNNTARIKALKVEYHVAPIPGPLGAPLIASAFGLAYVVRRRSRANSASSASR